MLRQPRQRQPTKFFVLGDKTVTTEKLVKGTAVLDEEWDFVPTPEEMDQKPLSGSQLAALNQELHNLESYLKEPVTEKKQHVATKAVTKEPSRNPWPKAMITLPSERIDRTDYPKQVTSDADKKRYRETLACLTVLRYDPSILSGSGTSWLKFVTEARALLDTDADHTSATLLAVFTGCRMWSTNVAKFRTNYDFDMVPEDYDEVDMIMLEVELVSALSCREVTGLVENEEPVSKRSKSSELAEATVTNPFEDGYINEQIVKDNLFLLADAAEQAPKATPGRIIGKRPILWD